MLNIKTPLPRAMLAGVLLAFACIAQAEQRSFDVSPGGRFVLDADWGQVEVRTSEEAVIEVAVERAEKLSLDFDHGEAAVTVRSRTRDGACSVGSGTTGVRPRCSASPYRP